MLVEIIEEVDADIVPASVERLTRCRNCIRFQKAVGMSFGSCQFWESQVLASGYCYEGITAEEAEKHGICK